MNRMDNLQTVFDRTDWAELATQKLSLMEAIEAAKRRKRESLVQSLRRLLNWLGVIESAARMDGHQTTKEPTQ